MRISDWSSDVCSSDLVVPGRGPVLAVGPVDRIGIGVEQVAKRQPVFERSLKRHGSPLFAQLRRWSSLPPVCLQPMGGRTAVIASGERSEEHTSELQSLMRISYAVFCLKKKKEQETHALFHKRHR